MDVSKKLAASGGFRGSKFLGNFDNKLSVNTVSYPVTL
jgi:hypothetical protein